MAKKITPMMIKKASELAQKGAGRQMIADAIGIHVKTTHKGRLGAVIKEGYALAREEVLEAYLVTAMSDPKLLEAMAKRLGIFHTPIPLEKPQSVEDVPKLLVDALECWKEGLITSSQLVVVQNWCDKYVKAVEVVDQGKKIEELEKIVMEDRGYGEI